MNEKQVDMYTRDVPCNLNNKKSFVYKHLLTEIFTSILTHKAEIFGKDFSATGPNVESKIIEFSDLKEYEMLIACDWNANLGTGCDIISSIFHLSNENYDFSELSQLVNELALGIISHSLPFCDEF
jgi:hypothetical protein